MSVFCEVDCRWRARHLSIIDLSSEVRYPQTQNNLQIKSTNIEFIYIYKEIVVSTITGFEEPVKK